MKNAPEWAFGAKLFLKITVLLLSTQLIEHDTDVPIGDAFFFGIVVLLAMAWGIESLLKWLLVRTPRDRIALDIAACGNILGSVAVVYCFDLIPSSIVSLIFIAAFSLPYLVCAVYLVTTRNHPP